MLIFFTNVVCEPSQPQDYERNYISEFVFSTYYFSQRIALPSNARFQSINILKVTELLNQCQKAIQESVERKSELAQFQQKISTARNAIANLPVCEDNVQASRQLTHLANIKHDLNQVKRHCESVLESSPESKKFKNLFEDTIELENMRYDTQNTIETLIKKWEDENELVSEVESWLQKKEESFDAVSFQVETVSTFSEVPSLLESKLGEISNISNRCQVNIRKIYT